MNNIQRNYLIVVHAILVLIAIAGILLEANYATIYNGVNYFLMTIPTLSLSIGLLPLTIRRKHSVAFKYFTGVMLAILAFEFLLLLGVFHFRGGLIWYSTALSKKNLFEHLIFLIIFNVFLFIMHMIYYLIGKFSKSKQQIE